MRRGPRNRPGQFRVPTTFARAACKAPRERQIRIGRGADPAEAQFRYALGHGRAFGQLCRYSTGVIAHPRLASPGRRTLLRAFAHGTMLLIPALALRSVGPSFAGPAEAESPAASLAPPPEVVAVPIQDEPSANDADVEAATKPAPAVEAEPTVELAPLPIAAPIAAAPEAPRASVAPLLQPRATATLPVVMYHHVDDLPRTVVDPYRRDLTAPTLEFKRQLDLLEQYRVTTVSLADLTSHFAGAEPLPERSVVLTFDDGYDDNYRLAYPLLRQYGMTGTFFIITDLVDQPGYMTWDQLRDMQRHGMSIESHTLTHPDLAIQPLRELRRQLVEARQTLESNLGRPVRFISYPSGKYSPLVVTEARAAGYEAAVTVNYGLLQRGATPFELNRVRVKGADTVESFAAKLVPSHWASTHGRFGA